MVSGSSGGISRAVCRKFVQGGWAAVGEVAALCWFLAQDEAAPITGANLSIDFGLSAGI